MFSLISRVMLVMTGSALVVFFGFVINVSAATGPWHWKDISHQIPIRSNRPIWAIAHVAGTWFYTDGQELTKTGRVWRTDGTTSRDITAEIRAAGISRVDSMVSDDTTVLFVKNSTAQNRSLQVLAWNAAGYSNRTAAFRSVLSPTEGIRSLAGNAGVWEILTTADRIVGLGGKLSPVPTTIDPAEQIVALTIQEAHRCFVTRSPTLLTRAHLEDSTATRTIVLPVDSVSANQQRIPCVWTGKSWMLVSGKRLFRISETGFENYGRTHDTFVTLASDGRGTVFLGGAVSNAMSNEPSRPLTAKLARVYEAGDAPTRVAQSDTASRTSYWTWIEPNLSALRRDQKTSYAVGAWNARGIRKIDIFLNEILRQTCTFGNTATGNQTCAMPLDGSSHAANTTIMMIAKITDTRDGITWTPQTVLEIKEALSEIAVKFPTERTPQPSSDGVSAWTWLEPNLASMQRTGRVTLKAEARAADGLNRIELIVNKNVRKLCDFARSMSAQTCELTLTGTEAVLGETIVVYAKAISASGTSTISPARVINLRDSVKDAGARPANVSTWMSPSKDILRDGEIYTFFAQAQDLDGLAAIDLFVDNTIQRTCAYAHAYTVQECDLTIDARSYPSLPSITITARARDAQGSVTWADDRSFTLWHELSSL